MDPVALAERIVLPDAEAREAALARIARLDGRPGSLGALAGPVGWLAGMQGADPPRLPDRTRLVVVAADHGIASAVHPDHDPGATAERVGALTAGSAPAAVLAADAGVGVRVVDAGVGRPGGRIDEADAMTVDEADEWLDAGLALADDEADSGTDLLLLGSAGVGADVAGTALVGLLTRTEPARLVGSDAGDQAWMRTVAAVRDAMRRGRPHLADHPALLAVAGGSELAVLTGLLLGAAARRTPVLFDGVAPYAAALLAHRIAYRAVHWWHPATSGAGPAQRAALDRLAAVPVLTDLAVRLDQGVGSLLALRLLRDAVRLAACGPDDAPREIGDPAGDGAPPSATMDP